MVVERRISAIFKDLPGGQILGPTFDYTHRLLDFELARRAARRAGRGPGAPCEATGRLRSRCRGWWSCSTARG